MNPQDVTNRPRDYRKVWESQHHLQDIPEWQPTKLTRIVFWLLMFTLALTFGGTWATWGGVAR